MTESNADELEKALRRQIGTIGTAARVLIGFLMFLSPYHGRITHSRHRMAVGGHKKTRAWSISYSRGRLGSPLDTGGHATRTAHSPGCTCSRRPKA